MFFSDIWKLGRDFDFPSREVIRDSMVDLGVLANQVLSCKENWSLDGICQHLVGFTLYLQYDPTLTATYGV